MLGIKHICDVRSVFAAVLLKTKLKYLDLSVSVLISPHSFPVIVQCPVRITATQPEAQALTPHCHRHSSCLPFVELAKHSSESLSSVSTENPSQDHQRLSVDPR